MVDQSLDIELFVIKTIRLLENVQRLLLGFQTKVYTY
jgi:hypothetical protein